MPGKSNVRTHTRKTATGSTTTVRQHSRRGRPRRALVTPGHAWGLAKRAFKAGRRKKRATAVVLGGLAVAEFGAWLGLQGVSLMAVTAGVLALSVAAVAAAASGHQF